MKKTNISSRIRPAWLAFAALLGLASLPLGVAAQAATATPVPVRAAVDPSGPSQLIETAANIMVQEIAARRAEFRKDPTKLYALVDEVLLPHFDVSHAARLVLGRHWQTATPEQLMQELPARLALGPRVLKQHRGHSGIGVWRIERTSASSSPMLLRVRHAQRGSVEEKLDLEALCERLAPYFAPDAPMPITSCAPRFAERKARPVTQGGRERPD